MSENITNEKKIGDVFLSWTFPEYVKYYHSRGWYIGFALIALGLLSYSLFIAVNWLFTMIILIFAIIIFFHDVRDPEDIEFGMGELGLFLGDKRFEYKDFESFWLIYEPGRVKNLYFEFKNSFSPRISIPLNDQNPLEIREFLLKRLFEDLEKETEPTSEQLGRLLKI